MIVHQPMTLPLTPNLKVLVLVGVLLAIVVLLPAIVIFVYRCFRPRSRDTHRIQVTRLGVFFGVAQAVAMFSIIGWGSFHPKTAIGLVVAHGAGVPAIITLVSVIGHFICVALARRGVVLFYQSKEGS